MNGVLLKYFIDCTQYNLHLELYSILICICGSYLKTSSQVHTKLMCFRFNTIIMYHSKWNIQGLHCSPTSVLNLSDIYFCRHNIEKNFLVWVNEEDHCRVISMQKGGDMTVTFERFCTGLKKVWYVGSI